MTQQILQILTFGTLSLANKMLTGGVAECGRVCGRLCRRVCGRVHRRVARGQRRRIMRTNGGRNTVDATQQFAPN